MTQLKQKYLQHVTTKLHGYYVNVKAGIAMPAQKGDEYYDNVS